VVRDIKEEKTWKGKQRDERQKTERYSQGRKEGKRRRDEKGRKGKDESKGERRRKRKWETTGREAKWREVWRCTKGNGARGGTKRRMEGRNENEGEKVQYEKKNMPVSHTIIYY